MSDIENPNSGNEDLQSIDAAIAAVKQMPPEATVLLEYQYKGRPDLAHEFFSVGGAQEKLESWRADSTDIHSVKARSVTDEEQRKIWQEDERDTLSGMMDGLQKHLDYLKKLPPDAHIRLRYSWGSDAGDQVKVLSAAEAIKEVASFHDSIGDYRSGKASGGHWDLRFNEATLISPEEAAMNAFIDNLEGHGGWDENGMGNFVQDLIEKHATAITGKKIGRYENAKEFYGQDVYDQAKVLAYREMGNEMTAYSAALQKSIELRKQYNR